MKKMKKKIKAAKSSTERRGERIVMNDKSGLYKPNMCCCAKLAEGMPKWVSPDLYYKMCEGLKGYNKYMANVICDNLLIFVMGGGRCLTNIAHVDGLLLALYDEIYDYAVEYSKKLELPF